MSVCDNNLMCELNLNSKEDTKSWLLKNHPDKGGDIESETFTNVINCYKTREYCNNDDDEENDSIQPSQSSKIIDKKKREKIYTCMRQTENWSKILPQHKFDNKNFDKHSVQEAIHNASPKLEQLFHIIHQVDENDMKTHGKLFKHFIFSDVKEEGYGAKILASAFVANGYNNLISAQKTANQKSLKLTLSNTEVKGKNKSFGMLSSTAIFNSEFNQKFKKEILNRYNKRPDNIHGEQMRFIILDSGFKEGIDLFDVKYVHIFEPSMTIADVKQTIGRATRTCGQKGLMFEPNVGWPLFVYNYYIAIPDVVKDIYQVSNTSLLKNPDEETMLFKNAKKLKDATILYSEFDKTLVNLAEQLYKLAPVLSVDFELTKNIHRIDDMTYLYEQQDSVISGGKLNDINTINCNGKCGTRSTKDIPATVKFLLYVYIKYGHNRNIIPAKKVREYLCSYMKSNSDYCEQVNKEWAKRAAFVPELLYKSLKNKKSVVDKSSPKYMEIINKSSPKYMEIMDKSKSSPKYMEIMDKSKSSPKYMEIMDKSKSSPKYMEIMDKSKSSPKYMEIMDKSKSSQNTWKSWISPAQIIWKIQKLAHAKAKTAHAKAKTAHAKAKTAHAKAKTAHAKAKTL